jgi:hypothetical protein
LLQRTTAPLTENTLFGIDFHGGLPYARRSKRMSSARACLRATRSNLSITTSKRRVRQFGADLDQAGRRLRAEPWPSLMCWMTRPSRRDEPGRTHKKKPRTVDPGLLPSRGGDGDGREPSPAPNYHLTQIYQSAQQRRGRVHHRHPACPWPLTSG